MKRKPVDFIRRLAGTDGVAARIGAIAAEIETVKARLDALDWARARSAQDLGDLLREIAQHQNDLANRIRDIGQAQTGFEQIQHALAQEISAMRTSYGRTGPGETYASSGAAPAEYPKSEFATCRTMAKNAVFILGFARSSTTIVQQIVNWSHEALILGEANFHLPSDASRFRDGYNAQHVEFGNQVSKTTYAPDFVPERPHTWWQWLAEAAKHYPIVGDKMAFTAYHLTTVDRHATQAFFESRFFDAKYIFIIREPIQALLSTAKLLNVTTEDLLRPEIVAWLDFVQFWADCVRTFPNTLTLIADDIGPQTVGEIGRFLELPLSGAEQMLGDEYRNLHAVPKDLGPLAQFKDEFAELYDLIRAIPAARHPLWQAMPQQLIPGPKSIELEAMPIGHIWARAEALRRRFPIEPAQMSDGTGI